MAFIQKYRKDASFREEVLGQQKAAQSETGSTGSGSSYRGTVPVNFRFADEDDAQDIAQLINEAYAIEKGDTGEAFKNCDCTTTAEVCENMGGPQGGGCIWYLAEARDKASTLLAAACYFTNPQKAAGQMNMFAVRYAHQQMGIGSQLLAAVEHSLVVGMGVHSLTVAVPHHRKSVTSWLGGRGYTNACEAPFPAQLGSMLTRPTTLLGFTKNLVPPKQPKKGTSAAESTAATTPTSTAATKPSAAEQKRKQQLAARMKSLSVSSTGPPPSSSPEAAAGAAAAEAAAVKAATEAKAASQAKAKAASQAKAKAEAAKLAKKKEDDAAAMLDRLAITSNSSSTYDDELLQMLNPSSVAPPEAPPVMSPSEQADFDAFTAWVKMFEKRYKTTAQRMHRFGIWRKNKSNIDKHNRQQRTKKEKHVAAGGTVGKDAFYEAELNLFADLTDEEYTKFERFKEKEEAANSARAKRMKEMGEAATTRQPGTSSSLSDLGAYGAAEVTSRGRSIKREGGLSGPTRGPVETELFAKTEEEHLTKQDMHDVEWQMKEQEKMEAEGDMYGMSIKDRKGFLVAKLKEDMIGVDEFQEEFAKVNALEQEQIKEIKRRQGSGVCVSNNYEIKGIGTHSALNGFSVA
jgi:hypothetical protein